MYKVTYKERHMIDRFSCYDTYHSVVALSKFISGNLVYYRIDRYNYKVIVKEDIISEEEI